MNRHSTPHSPPLPVEFFVPLFSHSIICRSLAVQFFCPIFKVPKILSEKNAPAIFATEINLQKFVS